MQTELAVSDRLCYKFNNQHRSAVFLRRAVEARRILKRIRRILVGLSLPITSKQSISWTHLPPKRLLPSSLHAIHELCLLLNKAMTVLRSAYTFSELQHGTKTFRAQTSMLVAIFSRVPTVCVELRSAFDAIWE
ncbi:uncharacterized protein EI90DRAFT_54055 [Cantharellus anzutake]|uniref:uncharacterized protein n=1 Tax=Cantharellus anzutake TaxID=1750568 RepID=UPI00190339E9|nr:uncharacterized protein EI90DRAFT_54055 [Cantharellus anzutake]KAF8344176.1 hypothetical protein EI90DRAFT_54055 [Cantharellus anzutake]